jgi:peptide chain release factor subunit 1
MLTDRDLRELIELKTLNPVLSVYLNTEPSAGNADTHRLRLRTMLKGVELHKDEEAVERYFSHEYSWTGRSVAVFSCVPQGFFRAYPLAIPVHSLVYIGDRPVVKQLTDMMDLYGGYGVVLVDKQGARLFYFHLGELREQEGVLGAAVKRTKRGGASSFPGRRGGASGQSNRQEELVDRNMKDAAEFAVHFFDENKVRRILIGGTDDNVALFRSMLPKAWQSLIMGTFPMSMTATHNEVLTRAMQIGTETEKLREARLVDKLISGAATGAHAVVSLEDTLAAINEDRVQTLVVLQGYREAGFQCLGCNYLTTKPIERCPVCEGKVAPTPDVVDLAVSKVLRLRGDIEVVQPNPVLEKAGKIGAILRY